MAGAELAILAAATRSRGGSTAANRHAQSDRVSPEQWAGPFQVELKGSSGSFGDRLARGRTKLKMPMRMPNKLVILAAPPSAPPGKRLSGPGL
jgi:hypothetical protein